jgi:hypothetical protein
LDKTSAITLAIGAVAAVALSLADCTVTPNEGCITGPCQISTVAAAGGGGGPMCMNPATGDYPCAVFDILHRRCHPCHATDKLPSTGAPFSLLTWEDSQLPLAPGDQKIRFLRMREVILPGNSPHMPFGCPTMCPPSGDLTSAERQALDVYFTSCAMPIKEGTDQKCTEMCDGAPCKPD